METDAIWYYGLGLAFGRFLVCLGRFGWVRTCGLRMAPCTTKRAKSTKVSKGRDASNAILEILLIQGEEFHLLGGSLAKDMSLYTTMEYSQSSRASYRDCLLLPVTLFVHIGIFA